jgi:hypothetical protein
LSETKTITFTHKEVVEALIKYQGLKEGIWQLYLEFGIAGANVQFSPDEAHPSAVIPVKKIGLTKVDIEGLLAVNTASLAVKSEEQPD